MKAITANPREGWIRASSAGSGPEVTAEIIRLSAENAKLRERLSAAEEAAGKEHKEELRRVVETLFATKRSPHYRYSNRGEWQEDAEISLFDVFLTLAQEMMIEASVKSMARTLAMEIRADLNQGWDIVAINQVRGLLADLMTLDLVQPSPRKHVVSDTSEYWTLTSVGIEVLKQIRKTELKDKSDEAPEAEDNDEGSDDNEQDSQRDAHDAG